MPDLPKLTDPLAGLTPPSCESANSDAPPSAGHFFGYWSWGCVIRWYC
jgi:hypothetical protein